MKSRAEHSSHGADVILVVLWDSPTRAEVGPLLAADGHRILMASTWDAAREFLIEPTTLSVVIFDADCDEDGAAAWEGPFRAYRSRGGNAVWVGLTVRQRTGTRRTRGLRFVPRLTPGSIVALVDEIIGWRSAAEDLKAELDRLHARVLAGSAEALELFCQRAGMELLRQLRTEHPAEDPHLTQMAIDDALVKYALNPRRYDPTRGHPVALLKKVARDALIDHQRIRSRQAAREITVGVDLGALGRRVGDGPEAAAVQVRARQRELVVASGRTRRDRNFLRAWLDGASDEVLAKILGIERRPAEEQGQRVGRVTERLRLAAKRLVRREL
jgi:hypothetical protein